MEKCLQLEPGYEGRYVALKDDNDTVIVGSGASPVEALEEAKKNGYTDPVFFYVPEKETVLIY